MPTDPDPAGTAGPGDEAFAGVPDAFGRLWTPHRMAYIKGEGRPSGPGADEDCPFDRAPTAERRGRPDRRPRLAGLRGAEPVPLQRRPPARRPVPARGRLHGSDRRGDRRVRLLHPARHPRPAPGLGPARVQHRHQPRLGGRRRHRRPPAPARGAQVGRRHQLHAGGRAHPRPAPAPGRHPQAPGRRLARGASPGGRPPGTPRCAPRPAAALAVPSRGRRGRRPLADRAISELRSSLPAVPR